MALKAGFQRLGGLTFRRPLWVCAAVVLLTGLLVGVGLPMLKTETDGNKLWVPRNSAVLQDSHTVEAIWGDPPGAESLLITAKDDGGSVLTSAALLEVLDLHEAINSTVSSGGQTLENNCYRSAGLCVVYSALAYFNYNAERIRNSSQAQILATVNASGVEYGWGETITRSNVLGGMTTSRNAPGAPLLLTGARALAIEYIVPSDVDEGWERVSFLDVARNADYKHIEIYRLGTTSIGDEVSRSTDGIPLIVMLCFVVMLVYTAFAVSRCSLVRMRVTLSIAVLATIGLGIGSAYGLSAMCTTSSTLTSVLPFLMVGIGVDNLFVLLEFYKDTPRHLSAADRMPLMLSNAALTVSFACTVNTVAFGLGILSALPAVSAFCLFAMIAVVFVVLYEITMLSAVLGMDERRMAAHRIDVLCCMRRRELTYREERGKSFLENSSRRGRSGTATPLPYEDDMLPGAAEAKDVVGSHSVDDDMLSVDFAKAFPKYDDHEERGGTSESTGAVRRCMERFYVPLIATRWWKVFILITFAMLTAIMVYFGTRIQMKFKPEDLLPSDSYALEFIDKNKDYFSKGDGLDLYMDNFDYAAAQSDLLDMNSRYAASRWISGDVDSWYGSLAEYAQSNKSSDPRCHAGSDGNIARDFYYTCARAYTQSGADGDRYSNDILWVDESDPSAGITHSRASTNLVILGDNVQDSIDAMHDTRGLFGGGPIIGFAYTGAFLFFETDGVILSETIKTMAFVVTAVFVAACFFLLHPSMAVIVTTMIILIDADLFGWMALLGINLNAISMVEIVMAVGLSVDWCVHVAFLFMQAKGTRDERAGRAVAVMGSAIAQGGFATFLAIVVLASSPSKIFRVFFYMMLGIVLLSMVHGLFLLPVLLAMFGPDELEKIVPGLKPRRSTAEYKDIGADDTFSCNSARYGRLNG